MKRTFVVMLTVLTLLFSMLPTSTALAAKPQPSVKVTVRNQTGGSISISLTDSIGNPYYFSFTKRDTTSVSIPQGNFSYFAFTPCGIQKGTFNLSRNKVLTIGCSNSGAQELVLKHLQ